MEFVVRRVLDHFPDFVRSARIEPLGSAGGLSGARFWRISTEAGSYVVRCWPAEHPPPDGLRWIHDVLRHAAAAGLSYVPAPVDTVDGRSFVELEGRLWEVAPWLPGVADFHRDPSDAKLAAALVALGRFHGAVSKLRRVSRCDTANKFEFGARNSRVRARHTAPAIVERYERLKNMHDGAAQPILAQLDDDIAPSLAAPSLAAPSRHFLTLAIEQLPAAIRLLEPLVAREFTLQPAIRDIWHDHVLYTGDEVTGLVDFGAMRIDTPAVDVARLLGSLAGDDVRRWQIGVAAYEGQRPLSPDERQAVPALDVAGTLLGGCNWVRWVFVERREFEQIGVVAARIAALHARLENFACRGPILDV